MTAAGGRPASAFPLFTVEHWAALGGIAAATLVLSAFLRRTGHGPNATAVRRLVCWSLAGVLLGGAVLAEVQRVRAGTWTLRESLPLHLCDIAVLVVGATLLVAGWHTPDALLRGATTARRPGDPARAWHRLYELGYTWGLGGTLQAVLTPDAPARFPELECVRYFVLHGGIMVGVLVMTLGLRLRPLPGAPWRVWRVTLSLAVVVGGVDWLLGANYMYLAGPPANPTIYDLFGPWPWALLALVAVGTALIYACHLPFWRPGRAQVCGLGAAKG